MGRKEGIGGHGIDRHHAWVAMEVKKKAREGRGWGTGSSWMGRAGGVAG